MRVALALASLLRHRGRTALAILGVAVSAAMLLDMVMLSSGMRESFRELLVSRGFQLRLAPKGTLPFDTEATLDSAGDITQRVGAMPDVATVSPVLGGAVHVRVGASELQAVALGIDPKVQGDYQVLGPGDADAPDRIVASEDFLRATGAHVGDTVDLAAGYDPELRTATGRARMMIAGRAHFLYTSAGERVIAMPLATLQRLSARPDRASLFMVRARSGADPDRVAREIEQVTPSVSAISIASAMSQVDARLSYFRQLSLILGAVSLVVGFLLVTTLVTVSVNERVAEIAVMRAIGVTRAHIVQQIVMEGVVIATLGATFGLGLGLITARWLDSILAAFPGLPAAIDFFLFEPKDAWSALGMLVLAGIGAGIYPAWRASSLPIAHTLREEAVA